MANELDYECPICLVLMIRPVTLPCNHDMCMTCFENTFSFFKTSDYGNPKTFFANKCVKNNEEKIKCPFCQSDIRHWFVGAKDKGVECLVNQKKWNEIQKLFPTKVAKYEYKNLAGWSSVDGECNSDDEAFVPNLLISEEGSLRKEYEEELRKIEEENEKKRRKEEEESAAILEMFRKEDEEARKKFSIPILVEHSDECEEDARSLELALKLQEEFCNENLKFKDIKSNESAIMNKNKNNSTWKVTFCDDYGSTSGDHGGGRYNHHGKDRHVKNSKQWLDCKDQISSASTTTTTTTTTATSSSSLSYSTSSFAGLNTMTSSATSLSLTPSSSSSAVVSSSSAVVVSSSSFCSPSTKQTSQQFLSNWLSKSKPVTSISSLPSLTTTTTSLLLSSMMSSLPSSTIASTSSLPSSLPTILSLTSLSPSPSAPSSNNSFFQMNSSSITTQFSPKLLSTTTGTTLSNSPVTISTNADLRTNSLTSESNPINPPSIIKIKIKPPTKKAWTPHANSKRHMSDADAENEDDVSYTSADPNCNLAMCRYPRRSKRMRKVNTRKD